MLNSSTKQFENKTMTGDSCLLTALPQTLTKTTESRFTMAKLASSTTTANTRLFQTIFSQTNQSYMHKQSCIRAFIVMQKFKTKHVMNPHAIMTHSEKASNMKGGRRRKKQ